MIKRKYEEITMTDNEPKIDKVYEESCACLLPIFRAAKEMCEFTYDDEDYFKSGRPLAELYHMAVVSKVVQDINKSCDSVDEAVKSIRIARIYNENNFYISNGKCIRVGKLLERPGVADFIKAGNIAYNEQYANEYLGAFQDDTYPLFNNKKPLCSVTGNVLNWKYMKDSLVLKTTVMVDQCTFNLSEDTVAKINEFCDIKQAQFVKQMQLHTQNKFKT